MTNIPTSPTCDRTDESTHRPAPLVSVVIATYNCGRFLRAAVDSVLGQTYAPLEVIVVNDGSTDDTARVMDHYRSDSRVRYVEQPNQGQTRAKNRGVQEARGEFVGFCDADDLWLPSKLAIQMPAFFSNSDVAVVYSPIVCISEDGRPLSVEAPPEIGHSGKITVPLFKTNFIPFGTAVVRRRCLEEVGGFDERYRMSIDWDLWLRLSTRYEFAYIDMPTYVYRVWSGQMSTNWRGRYEAAFQIMNEFVTRHPHVVPAAAVREAWADSYAHRGRFRAHQSGEYAAALGDLAHAILHKPSFMFAWKSVAYVIATAAGGRKSLTASRLPAVTQRSII